MCPDVVAHCHGQNLHGHFLLFFRREASCRSEVPVSSQGGSLPQVVSLQVGAWGPSSLECDVPTE